MTNRTDESGAQRLICWRCGIEFGCDPLGACWCKEESARLPMPVAGESCVCRDCLREVAGPEKTARG